MAYFGADLYACCGLSQGGRRSLDCQPDKLAWPYCRPTQAATRLYGRGIFDSAGLYACCGLSQGGRRSLDCQPDKLAWPYCRPTQAATRLYGRGIFEEKVLPGLAWPAHAKTLVHATLVLAQH